MKKNYAWMSMALAMALTSVSCSDDKDIEIVETDANYVGQDVGNFSADEWYPGGKLGTTENTTASCYSDQTPYVDNHKDLFDAFFSKVNRCLSVNTHSTLVLSRDSVLLPSAHLASIATQSMVTANV